MSIIRAPLFATLTVTALAMLSSCLVAPAVRVSQPPTGLVADAGWMQSGPVFYIEIKNGSAGFLCVSVQPFDTKDPWIEVLSADGSIVDKKGVGDPAPPYRYRGVDLDSEYMLLKPGGSRKVYIDVDNSVFPGPGKYTLHMLFDYYRCGDIIDTDPKVSRYDAPVTVVDYSHVFRYPRSEIGEAGGN